MTLALGGMTVAEMLDRMSGQELADWQAYEELHGPLGPVRGDWQAALVATTIASANQRRKGRRPRMRDFLLKWKDSRAAADPAEMEALGRQLASRLGGTWTDGGEPRGEHD